MGVIVCVRVVVDLFGVLVIISNLMFKFFGIIWNFVKLVTLVFSILLFGVVFVVCYVIGMLCVGFLFGKVTCIYM